MGNGAAELRDLRCDGLAARHRDALEYEAPFLLDRLVRDRVVDSPAEAEQLFTEVKRYLVLCDALPELTFGMYSARVDAAWHAFILFTAEYTEFGIRCCGGYLHHAPVVGRDDPSHEGATFEEFRDHYAELFAESLPAIWYDEVSVAPNRRVINDWAGRLRLTFDAGMVGLLDDAGDPLLSVDRFASDAMHFIADMTDFYVRELPGDLSAEEKVGLIRPLVRAGVLRIAP